MIDQVIPVEFPSGVYAGAAPNSDGSWNVYVNTLYPEDIQMDAVREMEWRIAHDEQRQEAAV